MTETTITHADCAPSRRELEATVQALLATVAQLTTTRRREFHTVAEVADEMRVSRATAWRWIRDGKLPATRVGSRNYRVADADLQAFIDGQHAAA